MAYIGVGRVTKYYDTNNEAEIEVTAESIEPGDFVKVGSLDADAFKISTLESGGRAASILRVGQTGVINVNGEVLENDTVYKHT